MTSYILPPVLIIQYFKLTYDIDDYLDRYVDIIDIRPEAKFCSPIMKITSAYVYQHGTLCFPFIDQKHNDKVNKFIERMKKYDLWLDPQYNLN